MRLRITLLLANAAAKRPLLAFSASSIPTAQTHFRSRALATPTRAMHQLQGNPQHQSPSSFRAGVTLERPRLTAWRRFLVGRRLHLTMGRSACRVLPTSTSREVRTTAGASCTGRARHHRGLARRYGDKAFCNCIRRKRHPHRAHARGKGAPYLAGGEERFGQEHAVVQSRHVRHSRRRRCRRDRSARRSRDRHSRRHPALAHQRRVLPRRRRDRISGRLQSRG